MVFLYSTIKVNIQMNSNTYTISYAQRDPDMNTNELFYKRWSPRSFRKQIIPSDKLTAIIDAARWSPSAYNEQPWRIITSTSSFQFDAYLDTLNDFNRSWAKNASVIGFMLAKKKYSHNNQQNEYALFDCGSAWMSLCLQARMFGYYTHAMAGFDKDKAQKILGVNTQEYYIVCAFVVGIIDKPEKLPDDIKSREIPNGRKAVGTIWNNTDI